MHMAMTTPRSNIEHFNVLHEHAALSDDGMFEERIVTPEKGSLKDTEPSPDMAKSSVELDEK